MMTMLEKAILLAATAHAGQQDKAGHPYILHPLRVMLAMKTEPEMIAGVLHDVIEDTHITPDDLRKQGFSDEVIDAVQHLSKQDQEDYEAFIERVCHNFIARKVKLADLEDNMDIRRLKEQDYLNESDVRRLKKYYRAWKSLSA